MSQFYNQRKFESNSEQNTDMSAGSIDKAQQQIYNFFLRIIKYYKTEEILNQFDKLFIKYEETDNTNVYKHWVKLYFTIKKMNLKILSYVVSIFLIIIGQSTEI